MKPVQFLFDFASPNAYLAHKVLPSIEQRTGAQFEYVPTLLGGLFKLANNRAPMIAFAEVKNKLPYQMLEIRRFIAKHKLDAFKMNPHFPVNSLAMMRAAIAAEQIGLLMPYAEAMFAAMWEDGLKMDDPSVFYATLQRAELPADKLTALAQDQSIKDKLTANTQSAFDRGAFGIPTFFVGEEMYFGKDRLAEVEEEILRVRA